MSHLIHLIHCILLLIILITCKSPSLPGTNMLIFCPFYLLISSQRSLTILFRLFWYETQRCAFVMLPPIIMPSCEQTPPGHFFYFFYQSVLSHQFPILYVFHKSFHTDTTNHVTFMCMYFTDVYVGCLITVMKGCYRLACVA